MSKVNNEVKKEVEKILAEHEKNTGKKTTPQSRHVITIMTKDRVHRRLIDELFEKSERIEKEFQLFKTKNNGNQQKDSR